MIPPPEKDAIVLLPSTFGWIGLVGCGDVLKQLTLGHATEHAATMAILPELRAGIACGHRAPGGQRATGGQWNPKLIERLKAYLAGEPVDFRDVRVDSGPLGTFSRRVIRACREIAHGQTADYGELAARSGYPGAARAVGNCMASNRIALVIPCHRVVRADGSPGGFSAVGGSAMKGRLLALEKAGSRYQ